MHSYKNQNPSFEKRRKDCAKVLEKFPDKVPVVCEIKEDSDLPSMEKNMFLLPTAMTAAEFNYIIRKRMKLDETKCLYIFVKSKYLLKADSVMAEVYALRKDLDGYLYVTIAEESTTGSQIC
ncbi:unnamed protein product [Moneuplotes crassus]|uniref:Autophagy-related protein n=1 Tax=Euplotes crassus TaxID=5936 RepID=A0AAD2D520_EUPCR|nr:unnamed protein product [Moneuplotes crassus]